MKDVCEHVLLVLSAILSDAHVHKEFEHLLAAIQPLLLCSNADYQHWIRNVSWTFEQNKLSPHKQTANTNPFRLLQEIPSMSDAYNNDSSGNSIAATLVENLDNIELIQIPNVLANGDGAADEMNGTLFNLSQCHNEDNIQPVDMENLPIAVESDHNPNDDGELNCAPHTNQYSDGMELVHYRVELMDQFEMQTGETNAMVQNRNGGEGGGDGVGSLGIYEMDSDPSRNTDIVLSYLYPDEFSIDDLPMEIMDTFERPLSPNGLLLTATDNGNSNAMDNRDDNDGLTDHERICRNLDNSQLDAYINWLSSVIEAVNMSLDFNGNGHPQPLVFSVPHVI